MIEVASHIVGVMFAAFFGTIGVCAFVTAHRNGGAMPRTNHEEISR